MGAGGAGGGCVELTCSPLTLVIASAGAGGDEDTTMDIEVVIPATSGGADGCEGTSSGFTWWDPSTAVNSVAVDDGCGGVGTFAANATGAVLPLFFALTLSSDPTECAVNALTGCAVSGDSSRFPPDRAGDSKPDGKVFFSIAASAGRGV